MTNQSASQLGDEEQGQRVTSGRTTSGRTTVGRTTVGIGGSPQNASFPTQKFAPQNAPFATQKAPFATRLLLTCGIVAGPLFLLLLAIQAATRTGFDVTHHPISLLSLGDRGWIQIANFVVTGSLFVACAVGMRRVMRFGRGSVWGPRLIGAIGIGLIVSGVFVTDPGAGFPAGAPVGAPELSWHGFLHELGYVVVMLSWTAASVVFSRRFSALRERGMALLCVGALVAVLAISAWPDLDSFTVRILIATAVQFGLVALLAARLRDGRPNTSSTTD